MKNRNPHPEEPSHEELLDRIQDLEIRLRQARNDLAVTFEEKNDNALKYLELMSEVEEKNRELTELKENLETLVNEKTAELVDANESLRHEVDTRREYQESAEKMAEEARKANAAKSEFLANMSHEIRTPLNAIINMTGIVLESELTREQRGRLFTVLNSSRHLLTVINDILDFSKIEAGKLEIEQIDFDLGILVGSTIDTMCTAAKAKGIELTVTIDNDVPNVFLGDENRIRQILINLIGNAIKFTERGSVRVRVSNVSEQGSSIRLRFSVTDTGIGIPLDKQQAIFDHFSQVDSTISRRFGGTGLGLSICRQLVHLMEGKIWVESDVGKGSVFFFTLKLMPGNPAKVRETGRASCGATGRSLQILVAEDNPVNVEIALHFLSQMGHRVRVAENGRDAIDALRAEPCDLVLMDVEMPVLDGFEATRKIRSGEAGDDRRKVPIIAMTAHAVSGFREQCLNVGMDDYLTKPVEPEKLADAVRRIAMEAGAPPPVVNVGISDVYVEANRPSVATLGDEQDAVLHLDLKKAMKLYNDNESLIRILCSVFLQEAPGIVEKMKDAIVAEDLETVRLNAHSLKSSSAAIGAGICSSLSARLEQSAKKRDALAVGNEFHELAAEFAIVKTLLQSREGIQAC